MRVLVTYGSTRGGTQELAEMVGADLRAEGLTVDVVPPGKVRHINDYNTVIVGGALYASRWHRQSRRFVRRHTRELRQHPTYFFSSGPLDDSASHTAIQPVKGVQALMQRVNARDHTTFGGRLAPDAKGYPASVMAKKRAGDWRDPAQVRTWTHSIATQLSHDEDPASGPA